MRDEYDGTTFGEGCQKKTQHLLMCFIAPALNGFEVKPKP
jgi:hypothetical protein